MRSWPSRPCSRRSHSLRRTTWAMPSTTCRPTHWSRRRISFRNGITCRSTRSCGPFPSKLLGVVAMFGLNPDPVRAALAGGLHGCDRGLTGPFSSSSSGSLSWCASGWVISVPNPAEGGYVFWARILTAYYFIHFLVILPLLGLLESPKPLPPSISDAVLAKKKPLAPAE